MTKLRGPGPNSYSLPSTLGMSNHDPTIERAPGYSFGSRYSYKYAAGPGPYFIDSGLSNRGRDNRQGFSLHGRPRRSIWETSASNSPGPSYGPNSGATEKKYPSYSFGGPYKTTYKTEGPGPNSYNPLQPFGKNTRGALIGGRTADSQGFAYDHAKTPGPGAYGNPYQSNGPAFSIGRRYKGVSNKNVTPGPIYNPPLDPTSPRSPRFTMGIRHHEEVITMADVSD